MAECRQNGNAQRQATIIQVLAAHNK